MSVVLKHSLEWNAMPDEAALQQARVRHRLRRADRYTSLCICAADALLEECPPSPETALITVSSFGPSATSFQTIEEILTLPEEEISPTKFSHSVENAACSYLGVAFELHGPVFALAGFDEATVELANQLAKILLEQGQAPEALVLNVVCESIVTRHAAEFYPERFPCGVTERVRGWHFIREDS